MEPGSTIVVLIHGFLDDESLWNAVAADLRRHGAEVITPRLGWDGPIGLAPFTDKVVAEIEATSVDTSVVIVGHSMGSQVAELATHRLGARVAGLLLLSPVPLGGTRMPDEVSGPLRGCGEDRDVQQALRTNLGPGLSESDRERLVDLGVLMPRDRVTACFDTWSAGDPAAATEPVPSVPTLIAVGADDPFVNGDLLALIATRYTSTPRQTIDEAGHWPHVERPAAVSALIHGFITGLDRATVQTSPIPVHTPIRKANSMSTDDPTSISGNVSGQPWTKAFSDQEEASFAEGLTDDVELHAATLLKPIVGRDQVAHCMQQASRFYDRLEFTSQADSKGQVWLEWEAHTTTGLDLEGVTVLDKDAAGLTKKIKIHHRPLGAALDFSAAMRDRTIDRLGDGYFRAGGNDA